MYAFCPVQVFGAQLGVEPVTAAMLAVSLLLATGVLTWKDCLTYTAAMDTLVWFTSGSYSHPELQWLTEVARAPC